MAAIPVMYPPPWIQRIPGTGPFWPAGRRMISFWCPVRAGIWRISRISLIQVSFLSVRCGTHICKYTVQIRKRQLPEWRQP